MVDSKQVRRMNERRRHPRFETSWPAWLIVRGSVESCTVVDISQGGARVKRIGHGALPTRVRLVIQAHNFSADCVPCHGADDYVGLQFIEGVVVPLPSADTEANELD